MTAKPYRLERTRYNVGFHVYLGESSDPIGSVWKEGRLWIWTADGLICRGNFYKREQAIAALIEKRSE